MEKILMIFVLLLCIYILGTLPRFTRKKETKTFCHCLFAHRGLFTPDQRIPENSMRAFQEQYGMGTALSLIFKEQRIIKLLFFMTIPYHGCAVLTFPYANSLTRNCKAYAYEFYGKNSSFSGRFRPCKRTGSFIDRN